MAKKKMPYSARKHIRKEKSRIRRQIFDVKEQNKEIKKLYKKYEDKRNIQTGN